MALLDGLVGCGSPAAQPRHAATYWYHPQAHELTWSLFNKGAAGIIIVDDDSINRGLGLRRSE